MNTQDILNTFNNTILFNKPELLVVLHKSKINTKVPAIKRYTWTLWYINGLNKYKLFTHQHTAKETTDAEKTRNIKTLEEGILQFLFSVCQDTNLLNQLKDGEFTGWNTDTH